MSKRCVTRCAGCPFQTPLVGTKGPEDSPFVIVGESPGTNEIRAGEPFVGESGRLLQEVLNAAGFSNLGIEPYIINALSCYPPPAAKVGASGRQLMQRAAGACHGRLEAELRKHPRKVILCLGAAASWSVTGDYKIAITQARGQILPSPYSSEGVVLTVHPAFLLRNGGFFKDWKKDIKQAVDLLRGERPQWEEPSFNVIARPSQLFDLVEEYRDAPLATGDIETDQLHWYGGRILCLGITKGDGSHVDIIPENVIYANPSGMRQLAAAPEKWSWHNSLFDVTWLNAPQHLFGFRADHDTMLMSYSLNENRGFHDLDFVAQRWAGLPRHKGMLDSYRSSKKASFREIPPGILHKYNAIDLSKQHKIFTPLYEAVCAHKWANKLYHETLMPAVPELVLMQLHGVEVDLDVVRDNIEHHQKELAQIDAQINEYALKHMGTTINPGSPIQMRDLLYDRLQLIVPGVRSTNEDAIIQIQRRYDHPICNLILRRREVAKRCGTYVANLLPHKKGGRLVEGHVKSDGKVYPSFKLHGTTTGRLAGADPNFLNQPRGPLIRGQYIARAGKLFVEVDENQAELRSLACMSGDPLLVEIYTKNEVSIHDVTTAKFYGSKKDLIASAPLREKAASMLQFFGDHQAHDWLCDDCGAQVEGYKTHLCGQRVYKEAKMRGKAVNFGIVYGREAYSLAMEFNISVHEAQRWIDEWFALYPVAAEFIEYCRSKPKEGRDLITMFGRMKRHGVVSPERLKALQNEAANFPHQSTASDIMLHTLIRCGPILRSKWGAYAWNEVYDAIYYEIDIDDQKVAESIALCQQTITQVAIDYGLTRVPFLGDAKVGFSWGRMQDWKGSIEASLSKDEIDKALARQRLKAAA